MPKEKLSSMSSKLKRFASLAVLTLTAGLFIYYIHTHPEFWTNIRSISLATIVLLLIAYSVFLMTNAAILYWSVEICNKAFNRTEALLLTVYSTLVNFFGPLQSGPGFRAIYLKKKHDVGLKTYGIVTLFYYGIFGMISLLMVAYGLQPIFTIIGLVLILAGAVAFGFYIVRKKPDLIKYPSQLAKIITFTALQITIVTLIYFVELKTVNSGVSFSQAVIYAGAANLALFVSLTPGAIGFREAFLLFTKRISHLDAHTILAASVIDRAVYFIFLGLLFLLTTSFHINEKLRN